VISITVCVCDVLVCPQASISGTGENGQMDICMYSTQCANQTSCAYYLWPWFGSPLSSLRYVMYFRLFWMTSCLHGKDHIDRGISIDTAAAIE